MELYQVVEKSLQTVIQKAFRSHLVYHTPSFLHANSTNSLALFGLLNNRFSGMKHDPYSTPSCSGFWICTAATDIQQNEIKDGYSSFTVTAMPLEYDLALKLNAHLTKAKLFLCIASSYYSVDRDYCIVLFNTHRLIHKHRMFD